MSLSVGLYEERPDGTCAYVPFEPAEPRNDQAGGEQWRTTFYGSERVRALGLKILPTLADGNIYTPWSELPSLRHEVDVLKADHLRRTAEYNQLHPEHEYIVENDATLSCLDNILEMIRVAMESNGQFGVCIE